VINMTLMWQQI